MKMKMKIKMKLFSEMGDRRWKMGWLLD